MSIDVLIFGQFHGEDEVRLEIFLSPGCINILIIACNNIIKMSFLLFQSMLISSLPSASMFYFMLPARISFHLPIKLSYLIIVKQRSSLGSQFIIAYYCMLLVIIFICNDREQSK